MRIEKLELIIIEEFFVGFERLKRAPLENARGQKIFEYENKLIETRNFNFNDVLPTTCYALFDNLSFQTELRTKLNTSFGIELFDLPGIVYLKINGVVKGLVPPFVERYTEPGLGNEAILTLQDGTHRFMVARKFGLPIKCIFIDNINAHQSFLPYALPNSWREIMIYDRPPKNKKKYRRVDKYSFMRPLSAIFNKEIVSDWADYGR